MFLAELVREVQVIMTQKSRGDEKFKIYRRELKNKRLNKCKKQKQTGRLVHTTAESECWYNWKNKVINTS